MSLSVWPLFESHKPRIHSQMQIKVRYMAISGNLKPPTETRISTEQCGGPSGTCEDGPFIRSITLSFPEDGICGSNVTSFLKHNFGRMGVGRPRTLSRPCKCCRAYSDVIPSLPRDRAENRNEIRSRRSDKSLGEVQWP